MVEPALEAPGRRLRTGCLAKSGMMVRTALEVLKCEFLLIFEVLGGARRPGGGASGGFGSHLVVRPLQNTIFFSCLGAKLEPGSV